jgi:hypothetical protein
VPEQPDQLDMPVDAPGMFATDEMLDRRIRQCEQGIVALKYQVGVVEREVQTLMELAHPEESARAAAAQGSG